LEEQIGKRSRRESFLWWIEIASRWADCDAYGHVNNVIYYSWFDTALTTLAIERGILQAEAQTSIGLCVSSGCEFLAPIGFPQTVDVGIRMGRIGTKSLRYELGIFVKGEDSPAAIGHFTHVYVDRDTRRSVSLSRGQIAAMQDLLVE